MAEWLYKATNSRLDLVGTDILAKRYGFLCRSSRSHKSEGWIANVRRVKFGDLIHFYFRKPDGKFKALGSFEVIRREAHAAPDSFGEVVEETALYRVLAPEFIKKWDTQGGYQPDPIVGCLTGWLIRAVGDAPSPGRSFELGQNTLMPRPGSVESEATPEADAVPDDEVA